MLSLNKKRFVLKNPIKQSPTFVCSEIRRETFKSGAEGIVFTFVHNSKVVRKYDIFKNKDGSTLQSQLDVLKRDLDTIDPAQTLDIKKIMKGVVMKVQTNTQYNLTFTPDGYVQSLIRNLH